MEVYGAIEETMAEIDKYTTEWLSFQSLWDLEMAHVIPRLKTLEHWMTLLKEIKYVIVCLLLILIFKALQVMISICLSTFL